MRISTQTNCLPALVFGMALSAAVVTAGQAAPVLDQDFDPLVTGLTDSTQFFGLGNDVAQTFTVGLTGKLTSVEVFIRRSSAAVVDDLVFDIRSTVGGAPAEANTSPPVLASITRAPALIPLTNTFVSYDLTPFDLSVTAGDELAIVLRSGSGGLGLVPYARRGSVNAAGDPTPYEDGAAFFRNSNTTTVWSLLAGGSTFGPPDYGFKTFVEVAADEVPEPATIGLLGIALAGLGLWRRRHGTA